MHDQSRMAINTYNIRTTQGQFDVIIVLTHAQLSIPIESIQCPAGFIFFSISLMHSKNKTHETSEVHV